MTTDLLAYSETHRPPSQCWVCREVPPAARLAIDSAAREGVVSRPAMLAWLRDPAEWNLPDATIHKLKHHFDSNHHQTGVKTAPEAA